MGDADPNGIGGLIVYDPSYDPGQGGIGYTDEGYFVSSRIPGPPDGSWFTLGWPEGGFARLVRPAPSYSDWAVVASVGRSRRAWRLWTREGACPGEAPADTLALKAAGVWGI